MSNFLKIRNSDPAFRTIADAALKRWNTERVNLPKCGARKKLTGDPCGQLALPNGRCRFHGGKTPKGDKVWKPVWPSPYHPKAEEKLQRKLDDLAKRAKKKAARLASMSPEELESYRAWHRSHAPGPAGPRERRRKELADGKQLVQSTNRPISDEAARLENEIRRLEALLATQATDAPTVDIFS